MILYANGCSMTEGDELDNGTLLNIAGATRDREFKLTKRWPSVLANDLGMAVINDAIGGASNDQFIFDGGALDYSLQSSYEVTIRGADYWGGVFDQQITISVNALPNVDAGTDQTVDEQGHVSLMANASDINGTISSVEWVQLSGTTVILINDDTLNATFTAPLVNQAETLVFQISVTDNDGAVVIDTISVVLSDIYKVGDVDGSGAVNVADYLLLQREMLEGGLLDPASMQRGDLWHQ